MSKQAIIDNLKEQARKSWSGSIGEERAERLEAFLNRLLPEYASALGLTQEQVIEAIEARRDYSAINYYQEANFPSLDDVRVYETRDAFLAEIRSKQFRCPSCEGVSSDPYECNAGECDWKAYGLFGTLGKGLRVIVKDGFLEAPRVHEIFMPLELEAALSKARGEVA